jgi:hypothetical protein
MNSEVDDGMKRVDGLIGEKPTTGPPTALGKACPSPFCTESLVTVLFLQHPFLMDDFLEIQWLCNYVSL